MFLLRKLCVEFLNDFGWILLFSVIVMFLLIWRIVILCYLLLEIVEDLILKFVMLFLFLKLYLRFLDLIFKKVIKNIGVNNKVMLYLVKKKIIVGMLLFIKKM